MCITTSRPFFKAILYNWFHLVFGAIPKLLAGEIDGNEGMEVM